MERSRTCQRTATTEVGGGSASHAAHVCWHRSLRSGTPPNFCAHISPPTHHVPKKENEKEKIESPSYLRFHVASLCHSLSTCSRSNPTLSAADQIQPNTSCLTSHLLELLPLSSRTLVSTCTIVLSHLSQLNQSQRPTRRPHLVLKSRN